jgi:hypothetical protein
MSGLNGWFCFSTYDKDKYSCNKNTAIKNTAIKGNTANTHTNKDPDYRHSSRLPSYSYIDINAYRFSKTVVLLDLFLNTE